jgi:4-amino-4-deoxy-L-arabinose transferase-like glycosyltransferase
MKTDWRLLGILLVASFLRVLQLDARNVWYDEAFAILYAQKSFAQMWYGTVTQVRGAAADVHPLFFYALLHAWMDAVGQSAFAARFLSVAFGVATVAVLYRLARECFDARIALFAAVMVALAPFPIAYAQEARMYAQLGFFAALFVLAYVMLEKTKRRAWWMVFVASGAGMLYSHNLAVFFGAALALWILWRALRTRKFQSLVSFSLAGAAVLLLWSPWLMLLPSQLGKIQQAYWIGRPDALTATQTVLSFTTGLDNARVPPLLVPFALAAAVLLLVLLLLQIARGGWRDARVQFMALLAFLPPLMIFVVSQWRPVYITRALMPSFLMLLLLTAWLLTRVPRGMAYIVSGVLIVLCALSYLFYFTYADFPRPPFRDALAYLRTQLRAGDVITHDNKMTFFPMYYYARALPLAQNFIMDPPGAGSDTLAYPTQAALGLFALSRDDALNGRARVWFVVFREAREESLQAANLEWLKSHYTLRQEKMFNDLELYLFEK